MGMFDEIAGKVRGEAGGEESGLIQGIMEMLSDKQGGGLGGIIQSFQQKGLGDIISSWIGTGPNKPISPDQVKEGLGSERVQKLAAKAGTSTEETSAKLSSYLPDLIDKATPAGVIPEGGILGQGLDFLKSKLS